MGTLYIIGNGFDLHHGMSTSYSDFHKFVSSKYEELESDLENYFNFSVNSKFLWRDFETDLGSFDFKAFFDAHNETDTDSDWFRPSDVFGVEDEVVEAVENLIQVLKDTFSEWIESVELPEATVISDKLIQFKDKAKFINFNYTDTLEELYSISKSDILYIHNNANEGQELIFGHCWEEEQNPRGPDFDKDGEPTRTLFTDAEDSARAPFYSLKKDTTQVIDEHSEFFSKLTDINHIIVLGHSLGAVDWPYFQLLKQKAPNASWCFSYYSDHEVQSKCATASSMLDIPKGEIKMIRIGDLR